MTKRKSMGKRLRFEVFKRDGFCCQYCGAKPTEQAPLVIDHITPVCEGGTNDLENLISACEPCNQGKSGKLLGDVHPRPDADLMLLEVQQEIAELKRFQAAEKQLQETRAGVVEILQDLWQNITGDDWAPDDTILYQLLEKYSPDLLREAIAVTAKRQSDYGFARGGWVPYLWGVAKRLEERLGVRNYD
jgi:hypothetical protein